jgi:hypothetical protein
MRVRMAWVKPLGSRVMSGWSVSASGGRSLVMGVIAVGRLGSRSRSHSSSRLESTWRIMASKVEFEFADGLGFGGVGHRLGQDFVGAGEVPEEETFGALQFVIADVIGEGTERLEHFAGDGFGVDVFLADPGMAVGEGVEGGIDELGVGFGMFEFFEFLHAFLVFDALEPSSRRALGFQFVELFPAG